MRQYKKSNQLLTNHIQYLRIHSSRQFSHIQFINLKHPYKLRDDNQFRYIDHSFLRNHGSNNDDNQKNINEQVRSNISVNNPSSF